jgi:hypothetical protein
MSGKQKPSWWLVYILWVAMVGLLAWDYSIPRPEWLQKGAAMLIVLLFGALIAWWLRVNHAALTREDEEKHARDRDAAAGRDIPPTPVQVRYLKTVERYMTRR